MGEFRHNIDSKGRIIIPARFRSELGHAFVITRGLDGCLFVYPMDKWEDLTERLESLPFTKRQARNFARRFFSGAAQCECDSQGRTVIPSNLREYGSLHREAVVIGVGDRLEIWSAAAWDDFEETAEESYEEAAETLTELDLF